MDQNNELLEKLKKAGSMDEVNAILGSVTQKRKLSLDELEDKAGGVPEYFNLGGGYLITPAQVYDLVEAVRASYGRDQAAEYLKLLVGNYYTPGQQKTVVYAFEQYGPSMWGWLAQKGY